MPPHFIQIVSKTFREKTKATALRKRLIAECLTEDFGFPKGGADQIIKMMREEKGYTGKLNHNIIYYERDTLSITWRFLCGDDDHRQAIKKRRTYKDSKFLGIDSLLQDGITTREAVEDQLRELAPPQPKPDAQAETEEEPLVLRAEELPKIEIQDGNERIAAICALLSPVKNLFVELIRDNIAFKEEIAKLGRERAFLNRLLAEYRTRLHGIVVVDENLLAGAEEIARELDNAAWARTNRLPLHTNPEKWHNKSLEIIYGPMMRDNFENKYWTRERKRVRDHLNRYAQEGRGHNSFYSKVFDTEKGDQRRPGVPEDTKRYWWNRVSDGIRFYSEIKSEKLFIYNIEPKESVS